MRGNYKKFEIAKNNSQGRTLHYLKKKILFRIFKENTNLIFFSDTLHNPTIEFPKLLHQPSLEIKIENSKGENFMKSITLDYFFHYTVAWDHPQGLDHKGKACVPLHMEPPCDHGIISGELSQKVFDSAN
jgi:hypothetical protein